MTLTLLSDNPAAQLEATTQFGTLLSKGYIPLIDKVIRAGVVPRFVKFLTREDMPQLQFMAAWTLTNITAGLSEHTRIVIEHGVVPLLVQLMSSSSDDIKEQVMSFSVSWHNCIEKPLCNIAGDSPGASDHVLNDGALLPLLSLLWNPSTPKKSIWNIAKWAFLNLCCGKSLPTLYEQKLLYYMRARFSPALLKMVQAVVEANVCPRLVELLLVPMSKVIVPALQILGDITSGDDGQTQAVIDANLITPLVCLTKAEFNVRNEAVWAITNATRGI
ncbi:importin subunit alpha-2 [Trifolium repens]|nr:importin subunit alpha-2 [Trifolium repens]